MSVSLAQNQIKVLFVEDSSFFIQVVLNLLKDKGGSSVSLVKTTETLKEACVLLEKEEFDVILLDLTLPDASGLQAFYKIHLAAPETPVVLLTSLDDESLALTAMASGAQDYLIKSEIVGSLLIRSLRYAVERKKTEKIIAFQNQALMQSAKLTALGEMASGIAHEINNPVAVIFWKSGRMLELLQEGNLDAEYFHEGITKIRTTAEKIAKVIRSLRALCRDGAVDAPQSVQLSALLEDTLEVCRERFKSGGVEIQILGLLPEMHLTCRITEISQAILNLLNNAYDAVESMEKKWIQIEIEEDQDQIKIAVRDSGPGLTKDGLEKLFQPLFSTKPVGKGTGLGLSLAKKMVESHQGTLVFDTNSKQTRFVIQIPKAKKLE